MLLSKREFTLSPQLQPFSPICYAVYPNMERGAFQALRVAHGDNLHLLREKKQNKKKAFFKRWLQVSNERSVCAHISLTLYSDLHKHKQSEELKKDVDIII